MFSIKIDSVVDVVKQDFVLQSSIVDIQHIVDVFGYKQAQRYFQRALTGGDARAIEKSLETLVATEEARVELYNELDKLQNAVVGRNFKL